MRLYSRRKTIVWFINGRQRCCITCSIIWTKFRRSRCCCCWCSKILLLLLWFNRQARTVNCKRRRSAFKCLWQVQAREQLWTVLAVLLFPDQVWNMQSTNLLWPIMQIRRTRFMCVVQSESLCVGSMRNKLIACKQRNQWLCPICLECLRSRFLHTMSFVRAEI